jgi:hypothetical protein
VILPRDAPELSRVPDEVRALLRARIESFEQLEILLSLREGRGAGTVEEMSARFGIDHTLAASALAHLQAYELARSHGRGAELRYVYAPASPALDAAIGGLARLYAAQPVAILKILSANAIHRVRTGALRAFADAFILRKDKDRG